MSDEENVYQLNKNNNSAAEIDEVEVEEEVEEEVEDGEYEESSDLLEGVGNFFKTPIRALQIGDIFHLMQASWIPTLLSTILFISSFVVFSAIAKPLVGGSVHLWGRLNSSWIPHLSGWEAALGTGGGKVLVLFSFIITACALIGLTLYYKDLLDKFWGISPQEDGYDKFYNYAIVLLFTPLLLLLSTAASSALILSTDITQFSQFLKFAGTFIGQLALSFLAFSVLYKVFSKDLSLMCFTTGAFWAALVFEVSKAVLTTFIDLAFAQDIITTTLVLSFSIVLWSFIISVGVNLGVRITFLTSNPEATSLDPYEKSSKELRATKEIALVGIIEIARRFMDPDQSHIGLGITADELAKISKVSPQRASEVLELLDDASIVKLVNDGNNDIGVLVSSPDHILLLDFIEKIEIKAGKDGLNTLLNNEANNWFWNEYYKTLNKRFRNLTLKDLIEFSKNGQLGEEVESDINSPLGIERRAKSRT
ncbi:MAG: hypothetical protein ISR65_09925 [Bacteriovoracaceae bacterium]|nr:hypothetical protein [Bacteriovoracaceae bacterium]